MTADVNSIPLWLLYEDEVDAWRAAQHAVRAAMAGRAELQGREAPRGVVAGCRRRLGSGRRRASASGRASCRCGMPPGFAERLPARRFRLAQGLERPEATQLCLGFCIRLLPFRALSLRQDGSTRHASRRRPNADHGYVAHAAESLRMARDWINTPAGDLGPAELAAAARQLAERHRRQLQEVGGRGVAGGEISRDSCGRTRERRGAAAGRIALGAAGRRAAAAA